MGIMDYTVKGIVGIGIAVTLMYGGHKMGPGIEAHFSGVPSEQRISVSYKDKKPLLEQNGVKKNVQQFGIDVVHGLPVLDQQQLSDYIRDNLMTSGQKLERIVTKDYKSLTVDDQNTLTKAFVGSFIHNSNPFKSQQYDVSLPGQQTQTPAQAPSAPATPAPAYTPAPAQTQAPVQTPAPAQTQAPVLTPAPAQTQAPAATPTMTPSPSPSQTYTVTPSPSPSYTVVPKPTLVPEK